jgi:hypothetical protein
VPLHQIGELSLSSFMGAMQEIDRLEQERRKLEG